MHLPPHTPLLRPGGHLSLLAAPHLTEGPGRGALLYLGFGLAGLAFGGVWEGWGVWVSQCMS